MSSERGAGIADYELGRAQEEIQQIFPVAYVLDDCKHEVPS